MLQCSNLQLRSPLISTNQSQFAPLYNKAVEDITSTDDNEFNSYDSGIGMNEKENHNSISSNLPLSGIEMEKKNQNKIFTEVYLSSLNIHDELNNENFNSSAMHLRELDNLEVNTNQNKPQVLPWKRIDGPSLAALAQGQQHLPLSSECCESASSSSNVADEVSFYLPKLSYSVSKQKLEPSLASLANKQQQLSSSSLANNQQLSLASFANKQQLSSASLAYNQQSTLASLANKQQLSLASLANKQQLSLASLADNQQSTLASLADKQQECSLQYSCNKLLTPATNNSKLISLQGTTLCSLSKDGTYLPSGDKILRNSTSSAPLAALSQNQQLNYSSFKDSPYYLSSNKAQTDSPLNFSHANFAQSQHLKYPFSKDGPTAQLSDKMQTNSPLNSLAVFAQNQQLNSLLSKDCLLAQSGGKVIENLPLNSSLAAFAQSPPLNSSLSKDGLYTQSSSKVQINSTSFAVPDLSEELNSIGTLKFFGTESRSICASVTTTNILHTEQNIVQSRSQFATQLNANQATTLKSSSTVLSTTESQISTIANNAYNILQYPKTLSDINSINLRSLASQISMKESSDVKSFKMLFNKENINLKSLAVHLPDHSSAQNLIKEQNFVERIEFHEKIKVTAKRSSSTGDVFLFESKKQRKQESLQCNTDNVTLLVKTPLGWHQLKRKLHSIAAFDFKSPSPDDCVREKQKHLLKLKSLK